MRSKLLSSALALFLVGGANTVAADFIDTTWSVLGFTGEAWKVDAQDLVFSGQTFAGGAAKGPFLNCPWGMSATYTSYTNEEFFKNPEFRLFETAREGMTLGSEKLFVHRLTCSGGPGKLHVMYPFVTNEARASAWYLYEGGYFTLYAP